jgi:hypothetical protein
MIDVGKSYVAQQRWDWHDTNQSTYLEVLIIMDYLR